MPEILLLIARSLAILLLVGSILLLIARWRFPQEHKQEPSPSAMAQWKELWRRYRKSMSRGRQRHHDMKVMRKRNVLVVDPDEKSSRVLVWRLEGLGCVVCRARNGTLGLAAANSRAFDIIIADALLPDISAAEFYQMISSPHTPVVFVGVVAGQRHELVALGESVACLGKPFDPDDAVALAGRLLTQSANLTSQPSRL